MPSTLAIARQLRALRPAKKRRAPLPRPLPPTAIERAYTSAIVRAVVHPAARTIARAEREIVADLAAQVAAEVRKDEAEPVAHKKIALVGIINKAAQGFGVKLPRNSAKAKHILSRFRREFEATIDTRSLERVARKFGQRLSTHQRQQLDRQVRAAIGVDWKSLPLDVTDQIGAWARENVDLIVTVSERHFDRIEHDVESAYTSGQRPETLARHMRARIPMAENDARRIARDQISKLNGRLARTRQTSIGVTGYTWRTDRDNRVRDCHADLDGTEQRWDRPPAGGGTDQDEPGHPGTGIQCRCYAEPDLSHLLG